MNKFNRTLLAIALLGMIVPVTTSLAEDIDIYARPTSESGAANPNLLIIIDNSANWADNAQHFPSMMQGEAELDAIRTVTSELNDKVNVGLMMLTSGVDGGYVRFKVRKMDQTNKSGFAELIGYPSGCTDGPNSLNGTPNCIYKNFNTPGEKTNNADYSAAMFEAFKYFGGYTSPAHATDEVAGSPLSTTQFGPQRHAGPDANTDLYAFTPAGDTTQTLYAPPITSEGSCAKNYVIFVGNGFPSQDAAATLLSGVGGDTTQLPLNNLAVTTTTSTATTERGVTACGTYTGADTAASTAACSADDAHLATLFPGYSNFSCTLNETCAGGSPTTSDLGGQVCYADSTACLASLPGAYTGYNSYSCVASATSCTIAEATTSANSTVVASTSCIADNLSNATGCTNYGNSHYPSYSGFSCTSVDNCGSAGKKWRITATTYNRPGLMYQRRGTITPAATTYGHKIWSTDTTTVTAATPTGTFSLPTTKARYTDEWARFLNRTDVNSAPGQQNVTTFAIDVYKNLQSEDQTALLMSMARAGGGKYFSATNADAIKTALRKIISEIQSVNSVFASSSLPVSVNTQGTYLNQVFMGMFRPEGSTAPRWAGNLKQYEFKIFNGVLRLADKSGNEAISSTTGFVTPCAASFWSTDTGNYWDFPGSQAIGDCTAITSAFPTAGSSSIFSDLPDGEVVEKGGAAQHLRGVKSSGGTLTSSSQNYNVCGAGETPENAQCRKLLTCDGTNATSCTTLTSFDVSNTAITATNLNIPDAAQRDNLVNWVRGKDIDNENGNYAGIDPVINEMRPSVHGGVVHSQPAVVDYGGSIGVVAFYGADDGVFHAARGNQLDTDGTELWGFIAPETYSRFYRLRDNGINTPLISFPADPVSARPTGTARKDYFFDGSIGIYQQSGSVWLYAGMRRGGRAIYAFDVSTPTAPTLKWRKGCFTNDTTNDTSCSTGWSGIGQTWSKPIIAYLDGYNFPAGYAVAALQNKPKPVLIFGGGYDTCEDNDSATPCAGARKGAQVWFVDADTGAIIRTFPVSASVPGDISLLSNNSGFVTHVYVSDINGDIYRINVGTFDGTTLTASSSDASFIAAGWSSNISYSAIEIAQLSETNHSRKFITGPNVVPYTGYNAVLIGSGDREHPLASSYACNNFSTAVPGTFVTNQFYMIKDRPDAYPASPITPVQLTDVTTVTTPPISEASISTYGWRFSFGTCEQSVNRPLTVAGVTYFGTNTPTATAGSSCYANLGIAKGYAIDFSTGNPAAGNARSAYFLGGGMPPSPVAGVVDVDGIKLPFIIGGVDTTAANVSALQGSKVEINPTGQRYRVFWYIQND